MHKDTQEVVSSNYTLLINKSHPDKVSENLITPRNPIFTQSTQTHVTEDAQQTNISFEEIKPTFQQKVAKTG